MPLLLAQMSKIFKPQLSTIILQSVDHYVLIWQQDMLHTQHNIMLHTFVGHHLAIKVFIGKLLVILPEECG